jgi:WD40 repeat protein
MGRWGKVAWGGAAVLCVPGCVFFGLFLAGQGLDRASLWAGVLGLPVAIAGVLVSALAAVLPSRVVVPPELSVPDGVVARPEEAGQVVSALLGGEGRTVGVTTGLYGAGGFGKTTLARLVCADRRVRRRFRGGVFVVTVGRDTRGAAAIAGKVSEVLKALGVEAAFTDPDLAGSRLGALLESGPRRLLVIDDVWEPGQLAPFIVGGRRCARLVTTRVPGLLGERSVAVRVDQMSAGQARALLTARLPPLDSVLADGLLAATGRWPLLLRLVNKILANAAGAAGDINDAGALLLQRLRASGPQVVDKLLGEDTGKLDVGQPAERARAVRATIEASTSLLRPDDGLRFAELGVFAEDEVIPVRLAALLWHATAGLDQLQAGQLCAQLEELALVSSPSPGEGPSGLVMHDVVRDFLRTQLGPEQLARLVGVLLDAVAANLPVTNPLGEVSSSPTQTAWWDLGDDERYLRDHLVGHLVEADRGVEADRVARDLRWVGSRLLQSDVAAPAADLSTAGTPQAERLRTVLSRTAHLLGPSDPAAAVVDVLHSRVAADPDWGPQVAALRDCVPRPRLVNRWPLPDLANPALRRVLAGHTGGVYAVAAARNANWLASGGDDKMVWISDAATGQQLAALARHSHSVRAVAIAPDDSWLATGSIDQMVRIWDASTGRRRTVLAGHIGAVYAVAVAPDGSWLVTGSGDGTVRLWDPGTGEERSVLRGHTTWVRAVAVAQDGRWLASGGDDKTARIWDPNTGQQRAVLTGHTSAVYAVAVAPDGSWLATGSNDGTARIWDPNTGQQCAVLTGHTSAVCALAVASDGSWLATGSSDGTVRIWDPAAGPEGVMLPDYADWVRAVAVAPDGTWLATGGNDGAARVWDVTNGQERVVLGGHGAIHAVGVAPDGSWLATGGSDGTVRIWDLVSGAERATLTGHTGAVHAIAVAPDGGWLATSGDYTTVRIWDLSTGQQRTVLSRHTGAVHAMGVAPDGSWLATGDSDGTVRIWDLVSGAERATLTGHTGAVHAMAVAPDGSWLATGSSDQTARVWDPATRQVLALMRIEKPVLACSVLGATGLVLGSAAGLYLFDFLSLKPSPVPAVLR